MQQTLTEFLADHMAELWVKLIQQIYLVGIATGVAIIIGIPLGIWATRNLRVRKPVLGLASILQTIPSLALLAFLLPFTGIGATPAIIALSLYALLPIIRNTLTGLEAIPKELIEAARGVGFTPRQRLWLVEMPLAMPTIIAGIRTATVISVGVATLAAFIGAGGLGDFINRGLAMNNTRLILLGAIPAALLALAFDGLIGCIERLLCYKRGLSGRKRRRRLRWALAVGVLSVVTIGGFIVVQLMPRSENTIVIASKNFTESFILSEMMAQMLEAHTDLKVQRKFNLGSTVICQAAMVNGEVDMYADYTGTAYLIVLQKPMQSELNKDSVYQLVKQQYQQRFNITWLTPFGFNNTEALAVTEDFAKQHKLSTISDLVPIEQQLIAGMPSESLQRPDGVPGLEKNYNLHFGELKEMNIGLMYQAIADSQINIAMVFTTDGQIKAYNLQVLQDDKQSFPPYYAAPLVRAKVLDAHPEIITVLKPLLGKISDDDMRQMNYQVDLNKRSPADVAHDYLRKHSLV